MGRPFHRELTKLQSTYSWTLDANIESLSSAVQGSWHTPLLAIGSGGSLTCAYFAALLHRHTTRNLAVVLTPLEASLGGENIRSSSALVLSASGRNADIVAAFDHLLEREPAQLTAFCAREGSVLAKRVADTKPRARLAVLPIPTGKDGFLATNSLLAMMTALARAYSPEALPEELDTAMPPNEELAGVVACETVIILHGYWGAPVAIDLESKFTEAALGHVQLADYRNFAHGRHHWLAKHPNSSIVALVSPECSALAEATLKLIPDEIPRVLLAAEPSSPAATLSLLIQSWTLVRMAGEHARIDPGRPGVPQFGRKLYHLKAKKYIRREDNPPISVKRKLSVLRWYEPGASALLIEELADFRARLTSTTYPALLLDYDGTICSAARRFDGPDKETARLLEDVLRQGLLLGIATGRGDSVRTELRQTIDKTYWPQVLIGYHNAGEIGDLTQDAVPLAKPITPAKLVEVTQVVEQHPLLSRIQVKISSGRSQVSVRSSALDSSRLRDIVASALACAGLGDLEVVQSSHSVDVLATGVTKLNLFSWLKRRIQSDAILCIGDRGAWPGNDYAILATPYSLSVDEVSSDPRTSWNLAPPGVCRVPALRWYLEQLVPADGGVRLALEG